MNGIINKSGQKFLRSYTGMESSWGLPPLGHGEVTEDGCRVIKGVLVATNVGVSAMEKERSSSAREDREACQVRSEAVGESEMV